VFFFYPALITGWSRVPWRLQSLTMCILVPVNM
jgi:hypothetical protein